MVISIQIYSARRERQPFFIAVGLATSDNPVEPFFVMKFNFQSCDSRLEKWKWICCMGWARVPPVYCATELSSFICVSLSRLEAPIIIVYQHNSMYSMSAQNQVTWATWKMKKKAQKWQKTEQCSIVVHAGLTVFYFINIYVPTTDLHVNRYMGSPAHTHAGTTHTHQLKIKTAKWDSDTRRYNEESIHTE